MPVVLSERGNSLIMVLVAAGLVAVIASAVSSLIVNQTKNQNAIFQKAEILDIKQTLTSTLMNPQICGCNLDSALNTGNSTPLTFNSTQLPATISLDAIYQSCDASGMPNNPIVRKGEPVPGTQTNLEISKINLADIRLISAASPNSFHAKFVIEFKQDSLILSRKPIEFTQRFQIDPASPSSQRRIISCDSRAADPTLSSILESVKPFEVTRCIRDGSNTRHEVKSTCPEGMQLLSCSGGPGDLHEKHEGHWLVPDFKSNTCILSVVKPMCVGSEPWTYQKSIALCFQK